LKQILPVYTSLAEGAGFVRDQSFPHQLARSLSLEYGLKIAQFKPRRGKKNVSQWPGLKPQQAELALLAEQYQVYILTRTQALAVSPWALVFPQELPNKELLPIVVTELQQRGLL
jgi:hypothetical protein